MATPPPAAPAALRRLSAPADRGLGWPRALAILGFALGAMVMLYWQGVIALVNIWTNSVTYAHGMMIVPISLWLIWLRRHELRHHAPVPSPAGAAAVGGLTLLWLAGRIVDVTSIQTFVVVALVPALTLAILGRSVARSLLFPLAFLFFAWPVGNFLVPSLQDYTAWFSVLMLKLTGIPVYLDGRYISTPSGNFVVADVCSGIRYLIASVAVGSVYAFLMYRSWGRRAAFMLLAIGLPIVANGVRAWGIITIAHWTDMEYAVGVDHLIYGWVFFLLVLLLLFGLGSLFRQSRHEPPAAPEPAVIPVRRGAGGALVMAGLALASAPAAEAWLAAGGGGGAVAARPVLSPVPGFEGPLSVAESWHPRLAPPDAVARGTYRAGEGEVTVHVFHYHRKGRRTDLVRHDNRIPDDVTWRRAADGLVRIPLAGSREVTLREVVLRGADGRSRIVWYGYQVGDATTHQLVEVRLREALARLQGDERGSALVTFAGDFSVSAEPVRERLHHFVRAAGASVPLMVPDAPQVLP